MLKYKKYIGNLIYKRYGDKGIERYNRHIINRLISSKSYKIVLTLKEKLFENDTSNYIKKYYHYNDSLSHIPKLINYYKNYLLFFCVPTIRNFKLNELIQSNGEKKAEIYYNRNYNNKNKNKTKNKSQNNPKGKNNDKNKKDNDQLEKLKEIFTVSVNESINDISESLYEKNNRLNKNKENDKEKDTIQLTQCSITNGRSGFRIRKKRKFQIWGEDSLNNTKSIREILTELQVNSFMNGSESTKNNSKDLKKTDKKLLSEDKYLANLHNLLTSSCYNNKKKEKSFSPKNTENNWKFRGKNCSNERISVYATDKKEIKTIKAIKSKGDNDILLKINNSAKNNNTKTISNNENNINNINKNENINNNNIKIRTFYNFKNNSRFGNATRNLSKSNISNNLCIKNSFNIMKVSRNNKVSINNSNGLSANNNLRKQNKPQSLKLTLNVNEPITKFDEVPESYNNTTKNVFTFSNFSNLKKYKNLSSFIQQKSLNKNINNTQENYKEIKSLNVKNTISKEKVNPQKYENNNIYKNNSNRINNIYTSLNSNFNSPEFNSINTKTSDINNNNYKLMTKSTAFNSYKLQSKIIHSNKNNKFNNVNIFNKKSNLSIGNSTNNQYYSSSLNKIMNDKRGFRIENFCTTKFKANN